MDIIANIGPAIARVVMGLFFWVMAAGLVKDFNVVTDMMAGKGVPAQAPLLIVTILIWVVGGGCLVVGTLVVPAVLMLAGLTILVTPVMHNFWAASPDFFASELQHFLKNIAIVAGLLSIAASAISS